MTTILLSGPMYSGKTTGMMEYVRRAVHEGKNPLVIKYSGNTRDGRLNLTRSHGGDVMRSSAVESLTSDPPALVEGIDLIGIDEGQFFAGLNDFCQRQNKAGINVVVAALNHIADVERTPWPEIAKLQAWAFLVQKTSICYFCKSPATCTRKIVANTDVVCIGGSESYIASCARCYEEEFVPSQHREEMQMIQEKLFNLVPI